MSYYNMTEMQRSHGFAAAPPKSPRRNITGDTSASAPAHESIKFSSRIFEFDEEAYIDYHYKAGRCQACLMSLVTYGLGLCFYLPCYLSCFLKQNVEEEVRSRKLVVTEDSIIYSQTSRLAQCRSECCRQPAYTKSIPIARIQDVSLKAPAGGCVQETLYTVYVQTAAGAGVELSIDGLRYPEAFRDMVMAMKLGKPIPAKCFDQSKEAPQEDQMDGYSSGIVISPSANLRSEESRGLLPHGVGGDRETKDILLQQLDVLKQIARNTGGR